MTEQAIPTFLSERQLAQRILSALVIGLIALALMAGMAVWLSGKASDYNALVEHTYAAEAKVYRLQSLTERVETARRGYLLQPQESYWRTYEDSASAVPQALEDLGDFTRDNPVQVGLVKKLRPVVEDKLSTVSNTMTLAHTGAVARAADVFRQQSARQLTVQMRNLTDAMLGEEKRLLEQRTAGLRRYSNWLTLAVVGGAILVALLAAGAVWTARRYARDLQRSEAALRQSNEGLEDAVRVRTADLTRANEEIQRFAYIVSHDLRSPLVNVMGFTSELEESVKVLRREVESQPPELVSKERREVIEQDLPEAVKFIRSSTQKMDRLINAILKLSREGRRTLTPEPVDVETLVRNTASSLRSQTEAQQAEIAVEGDLPPVVTDRLALDQVLSNLIENAVKYAKPGRPGRVTVRGRTETSRVVYEVVDNGRGIAPRDHARVFELFRRAGTQDRPGEGIGLAHVQALVHRLGGRIELESELDQGSTFRLLLPPILLREQDQRA